MIMPMTVTEVWGNFFSDGSTFDMDKALEMIGDKDIKGTLWGLPTKPENNGEEVLQERHVYWKSKVPGKNSFADALNNSHLLK